MRREKHEEKSTGPEAVEFSKHLESESKELRSVDYGRGRLGGSCGRATGPGGHGCARGGDGEPARGERLARLSDWVFRPPGWGRWNQCACAATTAA